MTPPPTVLALSLGPDAAAVESAARARWPGATVEAVPRAGWTGGGVRALWRRLRTTDRTALALVSRDWSTQMRPTLARCLAAAARAPERVVLDTRGHAERVSRVRLAAWDLPRLPFVGLAATLGGAVAAARAWRWARARPHRAAALPERPLRVLFLRTDFWFGVAAGGSVAHVTGIVKALAQAGHEVTVLTTDAIPGLDACGARVEVHPPRRFRDFPGACPLLHDGALVQAAVAAAGGRAVDLVYHRSSLGSVAGARVARRLSAALVVEYNGPELWMADHWGKRLGPWRPAYAWAETATLRQADLVATVSDPLRDELLARGLPVHRIAVHPNGVDPDRFPEVFPAADLAAVRTRLGVPPEACLVGFIGTFGRWHGAEVLVRAIRPALSALGSTGPRLHVALFGDGPELPACRRAAEAEGVADRVTFSGLVPQAQAPAHLAACDVLASPHVPNPDGSRFFGSPTKLFEYMAAGRAIVASALDQVGAVLAHERTALMVPPGDTAALGAALARLAGDPGLRAALGRAARAEALARYTWSHTARGTLDALRAAAGGP